MGSIKIGNDDTADQIAKLARLAWVAHFHEIAHPVWLLPQVDCLLEQIAGAQASAKWVRQHLQTLMAGGERPLFAKFHHSKWLAALILVKTRRPLDVSHHDDRPGIGRNILESDKRIHGCINPPKWPKVALDLSGKHGGHLGYL